MYLYLGGQLKMYLWILLGMVVITGIVVVVSYILNVISASFKIVMTIICTTIVLLLVASLIITVLDIWVYPGLWNSIFGWFSSIGK